jgi:hypothetical protein
MKKLLLAALVGSMAYYGYGQGLVSFANTATTSIHTNNGVTSGNVSTAPNLFYYGLWVTTSNSTTAAMDLVTLSNSLTLVAGQPLGVNSTIGGGIIVLPGGANTAPTTYDTGLPSATAIFVQVRAWDQALGTTGYQNAMGNPGHWWGASVIGNAVTTAAPALGAAIWSSSTAGKLPRFDINLQVPEPSTIALVGLGLMGLVFIRRRK